METAVAGDTLENDVIQLVAEFWGGNPRRITTKSTLFGDLGLDGDDASELLLAFADRFHVDLRDLDFARHFFPEGWSYAALFYWIGQLRWWRTPEENAGLIPVTIRDLIEAARTGVWDTAISRES